MNPFDAMNNDTSKNSDETIKNHKNSAATSKRTSHQAKNKAANKSQSKSTKHNQRLTRSKKSSQLSNNTKLIKDLSKQYSTDRLNMYDIIRLKLLQKVNGMKSRSQLINDMIRIVKPKYLNSQAKKEQYQSLFKYALTGFKINKKFK